MIKVMLVTAVAAFVACGSDDPFSSGDWKKSEECGSEVRSGVLGEGNVRELWREVQLARELDDYSQRYAAMDAAVQSASRYGYVEVFYFRKAERDCFEWLWEETVLRD